MSAKILHTNLAVLILLLLLTFNAPGAGAALNVEEPGGEVGGGLLLVASKGNQTLGTIDPAAGRQIAAVAEDGVTGHEVAASPDAKRAFVPIYGNAGVGKPGTDGRLLRVIDLNTRKVVGTLDFGKGVRPHCAVFGPKNGLLYVTTELDNSVAVIDPQALKVVGTIPTGQAESHMLAITRDGRRGYTSNVGPGTVSVLDLEAKKLLAVIPCHSRRNASRFLLMTVGSSLRTRPNRNWPSSTRQGMPSRTGYHCRAPLALKLVDIVFAYNS